MFLKYAERALLWMAETRIGHELSRRDALKRAGEWVDPTDYATLNLEWEAICDWRLDLDDEIAAAA
jgi:hypothetical protein